MGPLRHDRNLSEYLRQYGVREGELVQPLQAELEPVVLVDDVRDLAAQIERPEAGAGANLASFAGVTSGIDLVAPNGATLFRISANVETYLRIRAASLGTAFDAGVVANPNVFSKFTPAAVSTVGYQTGPVAIGLYLAAGVHRFNPPPFLRPGERLILQNVGTAGPTFRAGLWWTEPFRP